MDDHVAPLSVNPNLPWSYSSAALCNQFPNLTFDLGKWKKSKWREKIRVSDILFIFLQRSIYELKNSEVQLNNINYEMTICLIK